VCCRIIIWGEREKSSVEIHVLVERRHKCYRREALGRGYNAGVQTPSPFPFLLSAISIYCSYACISCVCISVILFHCRKNVIFMHATMTAPFVLLELNHGVTALQEHQLGSPVMVHSKMEHATQIATQRSASLMALTVHHIKKSAGIVLQECL